MAQTRLLSHIPFLSSLSSLSPSFSFPPPSPSSFLLPVSFYHASHVGASTRTSHTYVPLSNALTHRRAFSFHLPEVAEAERLSKERHFRQSTDLLLRADEIYSSCGLPLLSPSRRQVLLILADAFVPSGGRPETMRDLAARALQELSASDAKGHFGSDGEHKDFVDRVVGCLIRCDAILSLSAKDAPYDAWPIDKLAPHVTSLGLHSLMHYLRRETMDSLLFTFSPCLLSPSPTPSRSLEPHKQDSAINSLADLYVLRERILNGQSPPSPPPSTSDDVIASSHPLHLLLGPSILFPFPLWRAQTNAIAAILNVRLWHLRAVEKKKEKSGGSVSEGEEKPREILLADAERQVKAYLKEFESTPWRAEAQRSIEYAVCLHAAGALMHFQVLSFSIWILTY